MGAVRGGPPLCPSGRAEKAVDIDRGYALSRPGRLPSSFRKGSVNLGILTISVGWKLRGGTNEKGQDQIP